MATVYVNNKAIDIGNERLNCVQAAEKAGVLVPHYCYHPALSVVASCRMCLVEVGEKKPDGTIAMQPKVVPGCQTPVKDGTVIVTDSPKAKAAQGDTLEGLLLNHPLDCPVCDKAGECKLQDYSFQFGHAQSRMIDQKNTPPNKPDISEKITLFTDRCILCTRCVRFTREVAGTAELTVVGRGHHEEIDIFPGEPLANKLSGNVVDLCPVGALGSKDFLYKQRVWYLKEEDSVCPNCSTGCSIQVDSNKDIVFRLRPRFNPLAQGHFMCDEGRYGYHYINSDTRFGKPLEQIEVGQFKAVSWQNALSGIKKEFLLAGQEHSDQLYAILSPFLTVEEAYLAAKWFKMISPNSKLALGAVPVHGENDTYPKDRRGNATSTVKFTIRAEKAPNRLGVEAVLKHFEGEVITFDQVVEAVKRNEVQGLFLTAGYPDSKTIDDYQADRLDDVKLLVTLDLLPSTVASGSKYILPATSFAEKEGTYVNYAGLAQGLKRTVKAPKECRPEAQIFMDLLGLPGLYNAQTIREMIAREIPYFAPLAKGIGEYGVKLGT
ncbi:molybdopterin-dependent oxidoreductase [Telmatocola sphagniphila]|uniref:Molybdopterin-dependent oxidoreductase n=1 Tax=Telmatocola sphagniphila TaxID=1123043 RepID=A0A8E6EUK8_9BACT|nr:molybdopterin-dependent oxidoreductase [Telmatocola sphagniphila]QVL31540.1 molybdopterin-dependent oxidoreductase [Telmatocola sphagniphila]